MSRSSLCLRETALGRLRSAAFPMWRNDNVKLDSVVMTAEFLEFSKSRGNDLSTPMPTFGFPGLKPGDRWCLCAPRWQEAFQAGQAPRVVLRATHEGALHSCSLADLKRFAVDLS